MMLSWEYASRPSRDCGYVESRWLMICGNPASQSAQPAGRPSDHAAFQSLQWYVGRKGDESASSATSALSNSCWVRSKLSVAPYPPALEPVSHTRRVPGNVRCSL